MDCPRDLGEGNVAHLYVIRCEGRERVRAELGARGIATDIHYPTPDHLQEAALATRSALVQLPATEQAAREILTLPCHAELEDDEIRAVSAALQALSQESRVG